MRIAIAWGLATMVVIVGVGCDTGEVAGPCGGPAPRDGCGAACGVGVPCPTGLHCAGGACTAECGTSSDCPGGARCSGDGRCVATLDAQPGDSVCASVTLGANRSTPNVFLIVDRSSSMDGRFDGDLSRWQTLENALFHPTTGVVPPLQSRMRFGLTMYSDGIQTDGCPELVTMPTRLDNGPAIDAEFAEYQPVGYTPTGDSIQALLERLDTLVEAPEEPTVFVLATDGEPNTCENRDDIPGGRRESVAALQAAYARGIRTFVVSVGNELQQLHLRDLANAGAGNPIDLASRAPYWIATDTAGLISALDSIVRSVASCAVRLDGRIDPSQACLGEMRIGDEPLVCGRDWRALDDSTLELLGPACDGVANSDEALTATFPCGVILL